MLHMKRKKIIYKKYLFFSPTQHMWTSLHAHKRKSLQRNARANFEYLRRFLQKKLKKIFLKNFKNSVDKFFHSSYNQKQV